MRPACYMVFVIAALLATGCSPKVRIMAEEPIFEDNRMNRLALLGEGGVRWMGAGHKPDLEASRQGLEGVLASIASELELKGYDVAYSRPLRINFGIDKEYARARRLLAKYGDIRLTTEALARDGRYVLYENYMMDRKVTSEVEIGSPAYEYPFEEEERHLHEAASGVLGRPGCLTGTETSLDACSGLDDDISAIRAFTDADTICIVDVSGLNQTPGSKALSSVLTVLSIMVLTPVPPPPDRAQISLQCFDSSTGDITWWHIVGFPVAANNPRAAKVLARNFLQFMPDKGQPLGAKCRVYRRPKGCEEPHDESADECAKKFPPTHIWECNMRDFYPEPGTVVEKREPPSDVSGKDSGMEEKRPARKTRVSGNYIYLGMGSNKTGLTTDQEAFRDISGSGFHLTGGFTFGRFSFGAGMTAFDFTSQAPTEDIYYPVDDASYSYFTFDMKVDLLNIDASKWTPWVALEWTYHDYGLSNYFYTKTGTCTNLAFGVDVRVARWLLLRTGYRECSFTPAGDYPTGTGRTRVENITMDMVFRFRMF